GVAVVIAVLLLLQQTARRLVVSGLVVFHFLGVFSAITSPAPSSWVSAQAWVRIFRPHLIFTYINNAYQFYSPEPGPASLLWFCIEFDDGHKEWLKIPRKPETYLDPLAVEFFRRLSITTGATPIGSGTVSTSLVQRRSVRTDIPFYPGTSPMELQFQYSLPDEYMKRTIASYARHVAHEYGADRVVSVKVYRVLHRMLTQQQFAKGVDPFHKASYMPFFMGDFSADGVLKNPDDGLLYWLIPIVPLDKSLEQGQKEEPRVDNFIEKHAGSDPFKF
ncbi:MAG: hypothetical protein K1X57_21835, partial [Gemmataceae bacterium]|nr:hypothetical protein [Gemmataceae bacterium]